MSNSVGINLQSIECPVDVDKTFQEMFSNDGLKGIIEFLLLKADEFTKKNEEYDIHFTNLEKEMDEDIRPLPQAFKDLKKWKEQTLAIMEKKLVEHDNRIKDLEVNHDELRTNNDKDHIIFQESIQQNRVSSTRNTEQVSCIWEELNKLKDMVAGFAPKGDDGKGDSLAKIVGKLQDNMERMISYDLDKKLPQIRINMENIVKLQKGVKDLEGLRLEVVQLEEKTAQNKADSADLRRSVDENHKKFVVEQEQNHILANRNKEQISAIWEELKRLNRLDKSEKDESDEEEKVKSAFIQELEERIRVLEENSAQSAEVRITELENQGQLFAKRIEELSKIQGFDQDAFMKKVMTLIENKADRHALENTRTDFGMWFKKLKDEMERKLNRDELRGFEQRLIEILSQSFADKIQNDKDHTKLFKKLNKLYSMMNNQQNTQGAESPMITKQPYSQQACLACDHNVINAVRMDMGPNGPWRTPIRESNKKIARDERVYHIGGGFTTDAQTIGYTNTTGIGGTIARPQSGTLRPASAKTRPMVSQRQSVQLQLRGSWK